MFINCSDWSSYICHTLWLPSNVKLSSQRISQPQNNNFVLLLALLVLQYKQDFIFKTFSNLEFLISWDYQITLTSQFIQTSLFDVPSPFSSSISLSLPPSLSLHTQTHIGHILYNLLIITENYLLTLIFKMLGSSIAL